MKRIVLVLAVAALMAAMMVASAGSAFASANNGHPFQNAAASAQETADDNCAEVIGSQDINTSNGKKQGRTPTNCDHVFNFK